MTRRALLGVDQASSIWAYTCYVESVSLYSEDPTGLSGFTRANLFRFPVEYWSHIVIREGKTLGAVITFIDITERKQAEAALRKSEEQNRSLLQRR